MRTGAGVIVIGAGGSPEATIASVRGAAPVVYVAQYPDEDASASARRAGAAVAEFADRALSPGRARNAGYRHTAKARPTIAYVQFVESGVALDPAWLETVQQFMRRRPEVVAVEGLIGDASSPLAERASSADDGEIQTTGQTMLVRADAFEAVGGFRGDLPVNETTDLCIRMRRRGGHIWRIGALMGARATRQRGVGAWWTHRTRAGFEFAHGAALHGNSPEWLYRRERARAIFWGGLLPSLIVTAAFAGAAATRLMSPASDLWPAATAALGVGLLLYLLRIIVVAFMDGGGPGAWSRAAASTASCVPEFFGAWRFYFGGARARRPKRAA